ncbi:MAG: hypothetical protein ACE5FN_03410 [Leptospirillia bacterium]
MGSHPLTWGLDPKWDLGVGYDTPLILGQISRLSLEGDALLKGVAWTMLKDQPLADVMAQYFHKAGWAVFFTRGNVDEVVLNLRAFRIAEVVFSGIGLFALRRHALCWILGAAAVYHTMVMVPVLYHFRYNIVIELWLILFSAVGMVTVAMWMRGPDARKRLGGLAACALIATGIGVSHWHRMHAPDVMPRIFSVPRTALLQMEGPQLARAVHPLTMKSGGRTWRPCTSPRTT